MFCNRACVCVCVSTRQLILIIELYSHYDVYDYLRQIALTLCSDKVSEVRWISYKLVRYPGALLTHLLSLSLLTLRYIPIHLTLDSITPTPHAKLAPHPQSGRLTQSHFMDRA